MNFTTIDRIFSKLNRELKDPEVSERDIIEYVGEALEHLQVQETQEQAVAFLEVKNFETEIPKGFQMVLQVAKNNYWSEDLTDKCSCLDAIEEEISGVETITPVQLDCQGNFVDELNVAYFRPYWNVAWGYSEFTSAELYQSQFSPVRLANNTFFNSLVCQEKNEIPCTGNNCHETYTIIGTEEKKLRFSFQTGLIALAYLKTALDIETGLPLIPDEISHTTAITYYVKWKLQEYKAFNNRDGAIGMMQYFEKQWLKYVKQAKNNAKMPKTLDDYQDLLEQSHHLVPDKSKYYGFFGNLGNIESLNYKNI